jgi:hypothetical protein
LASGPPGRFVGSRPNPPRSVNGTRRGRASLPSRANRHCEERQRRSNPFLRRPRCGLLRGACHRARIRATRWRNDDFGIRACDKSTRRANQSSRQKPVQPFRKKYFAFAVGQISSTSSPRPFPARGALAIVTNAGWDAVDAAALARRFVRRAVSVSEQRRAGRTALVAYGKTVWSRHPLLVSSSRRRSQLNRA